MTYHLSFGEEGGHRFGINSSAESTCLVWSG